MSSSPDEWRTPTSSSSSRSLIAMMPSAFSGVLYSANSVFFTMPFFVAKTRYSASSKSRVAITRAHLLVLAERQEVDDRAALRLARAERQLVHLQPVDLPDRGEEEEVVVRRGDEEVLDVVVVLEVHAHHADPAPALLAVGRDRQALDVARARDRDDHVLLGDQVLELELLLGGDDLGAAVVAARVDLLDLEQLLADQAVDPRLVREDRPQLRDPLLQIGVLVLDPLPLEPGEPGEAQVEDRLGLDLRELELLDQPLARLVGVVGRPDQGDHRVEVVERDQVALRGRARARSALRSSCFDRRVTTSRWKSR